ncbi:PIN domain-containing protein [Halorubrum gandharaense]
MKADDWLASEVDLEAMDAPKTSVATGIELQYVMEGAWPRDRVVNSHHEIADLGIEMVPLGIDALDAAAELRSQYDSLNVFDGVHLGTAQTLGDPIVSTDTLYPQISEVESLDPRNIG